MIARSGVVPAAQGGRRRERRRGRRLGLLWPILAVLAVLAIAGLAAYGTMVLRDDDGGSPQASTGQPIRLSGITSYDPEGDNRAEHEEAVGRATDGEESTYWTTENYNTFQKSGVGLVLDAQRTAQPRTMTVTTDTPGYTLEIRAGDSPDGPFPESVSRSRQIENRVRFNLQDADARYFLVWITALDGVAHVNEVTAR